MKEKISILIPVFRVEKYIKKCISSVLNQTYKNLEIILIDDGSDDNCGAICDAYQTADSRIKVIHKENGGLSSARNAGLRIATGEYLYFLDSDDFIEEKLIEDLLRLQKQYDADIIIGTLCKVDENDEPVEEISFCNEVISLEGLEMLDYILKKSPSWEACGKLYKRSLFENTFFLEGVLYEDLHLLPKLFAKAKKIVLINNGMYHYLFRAESIMGQSELVLKSDLVMIARDSMSYFRENIPEIANYMDAFYLNHLFIKLYGLYENKLEKNNQSFIKAYCGLFKEKKVHMMNNRYIGRTQYRVYKRSSCGFLFFLYFLMKRALGR